MIPKGVHEFMVGATISIDGVLADFPTPILTNIFREPTREALIEIHRIVSVDLASVVLNLVGGCHIHLPLTMDT